MRGGLRIFNAVLWAWLWLSGAMLPVVTNGSDYWAQKGAQLFSFNPNLNDIPALLGNAVLPFILWFISDRVIRGKSAKAKAKSN